MNDMFKFLMSPNEAGSRCRRVPNKYALIRLGLILLILPVCQVTGSQPFSEILNPQAWQLPYRIERIDPPLQFNQPVAIESIPGSTNGIFILERSGRIFHIPDLNAPEPEVFLDLRPSTSIVHDEAGLLGMAFHPQYESNGRFFIYRNNIGVTPSGPFGFHFILSEFHGFPGDSPESIRASEIPLISQSDPDPGHNAGTIRFGPDGYLYFSVGDTGPPASQIRDNMQPVDGGFFGAIFRIDVDGRDTSLTPNPHSAIVADYGIPPDNPLVGLETVDGLEVNPLSLRTEIFAHGFRNPWKFAFHPEHEFMVVGEVGSSSIEELNIVGAEGGNFGWPYYEGTARGFFHRFLNEAGTYRLPYYQYPHGYEGTSGNCVIAGHFYQGSEFPELQGLFLFGDWGSGNIWAMEIDPDAPRPVDGIKPLYLGRLFFLTTFGVDPRDREVLLTNFSDGHLYKLRRNPAFDPAVGLPDKLSQTGLFPDLSNPLTPNVDLVFYEPNIPFWSDGFDKRRWVFVPEERSVEFLEDGTAVVPDRSLFVKHFDWVERVNGSEVRHRVETRLLLKEGNDIHGATYRWNETGEEAELVPPLGLTETVTRNFGNESRSKKWLYPSRSGCVFCHNPDSGQILGFRREQLNDRPLIGRDGTDQLTRLHLSGILASQPEASSGDLVCVPADDRRFTLKQRFKSYTASNCRACHTPGGQSLERWDARLEVPVEESHLLNVRASPPINPDFGFLLDPDFPEASEFLWRIENRHVFKMPPIGTYKVDQGFVDLTMEYLRSFLPEGWQQQPSNGLNSFEGIEVEDGEWFFGINGVASGVRQYSRAAETIDGREDKPVFIMAVHGVSAPAIMQFTLPPAASFAPGGALRIGVHSSAGKFTGYEWNMPSTIHVIVEDQKSGVLQGLVYPDGNAALAIHDSSIQLLLNGYQTLDENLRINVPGPGNNSDSPWKAAIGLSTTATPGPARLSMGTLSLHNLHLDDVLKLPERHSSVPLVFSAASGSTRLTPAFISDGRGRNLKAIHPGLDGHFISYLPPGEYPDLHIGMTLPGLDRPVRFRLGDFHILNSPESASSQALIDRLTPTEYDALSRLAPLQVLGNTTPRPRPFEWAVHAGTVTPAGISSNTDGSEQMVRWSLHSATSAREHQVFEILPAERSGFSATIRLRSPSTMEVIQEYTIEEISDPPEDSGVLIGIRSEEPVLFEVVSEENRSFTLTRLRLISGSSHTGEFHQATMEVSTATDPIRPSVPLSIFNPQWPDSRKPQRVRFLDSNGLIATDTNEPFALIRRHDPAEQNTYAIAEFGDGATQFISGKTIAPVHSIEDPRVHDQAVYPLVNGQWMESLGSISWQIPYQSPVSTDGTRQVAIRNLRATSNGWSEFDYTHPNLLEDPLSRVGAKLTTFWYSRDNITFQIRPMTADPYRLSLYFMDVIDSGPRSQLVSLIHPQSREPLQQTIVEPVLSGELFSWTVSGNIDVTIQRLNNIFSLLSGIFIDEPVADFFTPAVIQSLNPSKGMILGVTGPPGTPYELQSSHNLSSWETIESGLLDRNGLSSPVFPIPIPDSSAPAPDSRFYRARMNPRQ